MRARGVVIRDRPIRAKALRPAGCLLATLLAAGPASAQTSQRANVERYDIPAQRLSLALADFSEISSVDVLLDEPEAAGRRSSSLIGAYPPPQALSVLLRGTGLVARFTSARSAVIVPIARARSPLPAGPGETHAAIALDTMRVSAPLIVGGTPDIVDTTFPNAMAVLIRQVITASGPAPRGEASRVRIQTRILPNGTLHDVQIAIPSGDRVQDTRVLQLLEGRRLDLQPPVGLRQPLMFDVAIR